MKRYIIFFFAIFSWTMPALSISIDPSILDAALNNNATSEPISITGTSQSDHLHKNSITNPPRAPQKL